MSVQQSIFHGVPLIVMPFGGDQTLNARVIQKMGFGIHLEISEMTEESLSGSIKELLNNKK